MFALHTFNYWCTYQNIQWRTFSVHKTWIPHSGWFVICRKHVKKAEKINDFSGDYQPIEMTKQMLLQKKIPIFCVQAPFHTHYLIQAGVTSARHSLPFVLSAMSQVVVSRGTSSRKNVGCIFSTANGDSFLSSDKIVIFTLNSEWFRYLASSRFFGVE